MPDTAQIALRVTSRDTADTDGSWDLGLEYEATETFDRVTRDVVDLDDDDPHAVAFGDLPSAALVFLKAIGGKCRARITTTDGATQSIPIDPVGFLVSLSVPVTAIDLTRVAASGVTVRVRVALGATPV